jgi:hypothetical protein
MAGIAAQACGARLVLVAAVAAARGDDGSVQIARRGRNAAGSWSESRRPEAGGAREAQV